MISRRRHDLVFAIYLQARGFAFVLFEGWLAPVDWGVYDPRGADKNARCLTRIASLLELHTPDVLVFQDMSERGTLRAPRIQELNVVCVATGEAERQWIAKGVDNHVDSRRQRQRSRLRSSRAMADKPLPIGWALAWRPRGATCPAFSIKPVQGARRNWCCCYGSEGWPAEKYFFNSIGTKRT